jgi:tRNA(fMet)-specific endonuclease VapC
MRGYTLDTNIVTAYLKRHPLVRQRIRQAESAGYPVMLNAVSYYETKRGLLFADARTQMRLFEQLWHSQGIVMLDQAALDSAAQMYAELRAAGQLLEDADLLMATIALANDLALVTPKTDHFARLTTLLLEDWLLP